MPILQGRSILWVDNHHGEAGDAIDLLVDSGAQLDLPENLSDGIKCLSEKDYDLAIIDIHLPPGGDGELPLSIQSIQRKYNLFDVEEDNGLFLATWIYENKRYIPFIFLSWFPQRLYRYKSVVGKIDPKFQKSVIKDETMLTARFSEFILETIQGHADE